MYLTNNIAQVYLSILLYTTFGFKYIPRSNLKNPFYSFKFNIHIAHKQINLFRDKKYEPIKKVTLL